MKETADSFAGSGIFTLLGSLCKNVMLTFQHFYRNVGELQVRRSSGTQATPDRLPNRRRQTVPGRDKALQKQRSQPIGRGAGFIAGRTRRILLAQRLSRHQNGVTSRVAGLPTAAVPSQLDSASAV
jgi:hypothetical protein